MSGFYPKKRYGQHFLTDNNIAIKIVKSLRKQQPVLEVGPGKGILTGIMADIFHDNLKVIEIDKCAVEYIIEHIKLPSENVIYKDFLKTELRSLFDGEFTIIGNFPYNISSQIFFRILECREIVTEVVCMIQREVAQRICSKHGNRVYGILSVFLQTFYDIEYLFTVNEKVFFPRPKVKSAVIRLSRNNRKEPDCDEELFFKVVKTAFNQRRKILLNSLKGLLEGGNKFNALLSLRPEQLTPDDFISLTQYIQEQ